MHDKPLSIAPLFILVKQFRTVVSLGRRPLICFFRPSWACAMLPTASALNLLSKSDNLASLNTLKRTFFIISFSISTYNSPSKHCLIRAFKVFFRISFVVRVLVSVSELSCVAPQKAVATRNRSGSTLEMFHLKDRKTLRLVLDSNRLRRALSFVSVVTLPNTSSTLARSNLISSLFSFSTPRSHLISSSNSACPRSTSSRSRIMVSCKAFRASTDANCCSVTFRRAVVKRSLSSSSCAHCARSDAMQRSLSSNFSFVSSSLVFSRCICGCPMARYPTTRHVYTNFNQTPARSGYTAQGVGGWREM